MKKTIHTRIKSVREYLKRSKTSCLIVSSQANITYTTGFTGHDSRVIITSRAVYLVTDSRYTEQAKGQCHDCKIIQRTSAMAEAIAKVINKLKSIKTVAVEDGVSVAEFAALKKNIKARVNTTAGVIETVRDCKDNSEIKAIEKAGEIAAQALKNTMKFMKPSITENHLAGRLDLEIRKLGATISFDTIVAFGANASRPHHQPGGTKLKKNDTVLIDFGARYKNYCSDITRCFAIGKVSRLYRKAYNAVAQSQSAAIEMVKAGVENREVDAAAREVIKKQGFEVFGHGTGHGLGLEVHESPVLSPKAKGKLIAGQIVTIEPGIYIPGKLGIRIEDDILVTNSGCKLLTHCPKEKY